MSNAAKRMKFRSSRPFLGKTQAILAAILLVVFSANIALAQDDAEEEIPRPDTVTLLPETTVAFVQIDDFRDLTEKWMAGSGGQFVTDENIAPLWNRAIQEGRDAYSKVEEQVGLSLEEIQSLPAGEMTIAVIAPRRKSPVFMVIVELDDENEAVDKALDRLRDIAEQEGEGFEDVEKDTGIKYEKTSIDGQAVFTARKDGLLIACSDEKELDEFFMRWMGEEVKKVRPLSENRKFITIMNRCASKKELKAEARFFIDPIGIFKSASRGNVGMSAASAFLPTLGLDGLNGAGGSMVLGDEEYEFVINAHLLLASPRKGILEMISLKPAYYEPETWMPTQVQNYVTTSWDVDQMYAELTKMVDLFTEEGNFESLVEDNVNSRLELDLREDILSLLTGRITFANATVEPAVAINSAGNIFSFGVKDVDKAKETIQSLLEKFREENEDFDEDSLTVSEYEDIEYWAASQEKLEERSDSQRERMRERAERRGQTNVQTEIRFPDPCFGFIGDSLVITDSRELMKNVIDVHNGTKEALRDNDDYIKMSRKMTALLDTDMPCAVSFSQPEHQMKMWMDLAKADSTQQSLNSRAEGGNEFFSILKGALDDHPLPDFEDVKKYFRPNGWFMTSDDTGYHMLWFQEKLVLPEDE